MSEEFRDVKIKSGEKVEEDTLKMEKQEFFIPCDGIALHAKLDFPAEEKETYPMVIIIHGLTGHMEETHIRGVAAACNRIGYATLRVEMYGHGKSEGEFKNHTVMHWVLEIMRVIDYARSLDFVSRLYLAGHSQGGASSVLAAGLKADCLEALLPLSPAMMIRDAAWDGTFPAVARNPEKPDELLLFEKYILDRNYINVAKMLPFADAVQNFKKPVLIVHADTDEQVPYEYSVKLQKDYANARLVTIKGDDHVYSHHLDQVEDAVTEFLKEFL